jgi:hypothetical protein
LTPLIYHVLSPSSYPKWIAAVTFARKINSIIESLDNLAVSLTGTEFAPRVAIVRAQLALISRETETSKIPAHDPGSPGEKTLLDAACGP